MKKERYMKELAKELAYALTFRYCDDQKRKLDNDLKEMQDNLNESILKQEEESKKMEMMVEHPEWFINSSPREFGMKRKSKKIKRKY